MSNKENPVPSLDLEHYKKFLIKRGFTNNGPIMYAHLNPLKAYLKQYGVETNNEQPKCTVCGKPTDRKHAYQNVYVCIDCSH